MGYTPLLGRDILSPMNQDYRRVDSFLSQGLFF